VKICRFGKRLPPVGAHPPLVEAHDWDAIVQEWWVSDPQGGEHGFVVSRRPDLTDPSDLVFDLGTRSTPDALGVHCSDADGNTALNFVDLPVWDADGWELASLFEAGEAPRQIRGGECGARHPITRGPQGIGCNSGIGEAVAQGALENGTLPLVSTGAPPLATPLFILQGDGNPGSLNVSETWSGQAHDDRDKIRGSKAPGMNLQSNQGAGLWAGLIFCEK
jgi:hypothetical protein